MNRKLASIALAGALMVVAAPAFAQDTNLMPFGLNLNPLGLDLDPFHIFTPAPPPPQVNLAPPAMRGHRMMRRPFHGRTMKKMAMKKKMMAHKTMKKK